MTILQILSIRPVLEMLLEGVSTIDRGDGSLVNFDFGGGILDGRHDGLAVAGQMEDSECAVSKVGWI